MGFLKNLDNLFDNYLSDVYLTNLAIDELVWVKLKLTELNKKYQQNTVINNHNTSPKELKADNENAENLKQFIIEMNGIKAEIKKDFKDLSLEEIKKIDNYIKEDLELNQKQIQDNGKIVSDELQKAIIINLSGRTVLEVCKTLISEKTAEQGMEK